MGAPTAISRFPTVTVAPVLSRRAQAWVFPMTALTIVSAAVFWLVHASIIDDSYITLSYARNLAFHGHWGLIPQRTSNTATSPLNVLVLAALTAVLRHPVWALAVLFIGANVVLGCALLRIVRALTLPVRGALIGWGLVLVNPLLLSTVGLEVTLSAAMLGLLLMAAVRTRPATFGLYAGLAVLTRIDLAIIAVVVFAAARPLWSGWWKTLLTGAAMTIPWFAFSWVALGSFVPDTLIIKTQQKSWGAYQFGNGPLLYLRIYPAATILAFLPAILGILALLGWAAAHPRRRRPASRLVLPAAFGLAGVLHFLAYTALGVPPYHWYYGPSLICLSIFLALAAAAAPLAWHAVSALIGLVVVCQAGFDVQHGLPWREAAVTTNWATPAQYATLGTQLPQLVGDHPVRAGGEIGAIAYFCDCAIVDPFSDRAQLLPIIDAVTAKASPLARWLITLNYRFLDRATPPLHTEYALADVGQAPPGVPAWRATSSWHGPGAPGRGYYTLTPTP
jgi:hypothetical protein